MNAPPLSRARQTMGRKAALACVLPLFFIWGFLTSLNDVLVPHLKAVFALDHARAMLVKTAFFGAYVLIPVLAARWVARHRPTTGMGTGLAVAALGALCFVPAAGMHRFPLFLLSLFVLASGVVVLQVTATSYATQLGASRTSAARLTLAQGLYSLGTVLAPLAGAWLLLGASRQTDAGYAGPAGLVQAAYAVMALVLLLTAVVVLRLPLPLTKVSPSPAAAPVRKLLQHRPLRGAWLALFCFVGAEIAMGSLLILYAALPQVAAMEMGQAAPLVSMYWSGTMLGRFAGAALMLKVPAHRLRFWAAAINMALLTVVIGATGALPLYCLVLAGLFNSIIFPSLFAQGIAGLGSQATAGSGLLLIAVAGGAVVPMLQGLLADHAGLQVSFIVPLCCYVAVMVFGAPVRNNCNGEH